MLLNGALECLTGESHLNALLGSFEVVEPLYSLSRLASCALERRLEDAFRAIMHSDLPQILITALGSFFLLLSLVMQRSGRIIKCPALVD